MVKDSGREGHWKCCPDPSKTSDPGDGLLILCDNAIRRQTGMRAPTHSLITWTTTYWIRMCVLQSENQVFRIQCSDYSKVKWTCVNSQNIHQSINRKNALLSRSKPEQLKKKSNDKQDNYSVGDLNKTYPLASQINDLSPSLTLHHLFNSKAQSVRVKIRGTMNGLQIFRHWVCPRKD